MLRSHQFTLKDYGV